MLIFVVIFSYRYSLFCKEQFGFQKVKLNMGISSAEDIKSQDK